jgi:iron(III) transport system ATP-binding protein
VNAAPLLHVRDLHHCYGTRTVLRGVSFQLARGELACLLGPSGCGKTTLLRLVSGFEAPESGSVQVEGETLSAPGSVVAPERRRMGMVFQDFALFPHLDVAANVGFGLAGQPAAQRAARAAELLELVDLAGADRRYPHQLSGGQQQRVALARALAPRPRLVLLDEPFSGLDTTLRERLAAEVRAILRREGSTALMVTHDQHEAFALADVVGVMNDGCIEQWGAAPQVYHAPATRFVAGFVGEGALVRGRACEGGVRTALGILPVQCPVDMGVTMDVLLRPDQLELAEPGQCPGVVRARAFRGAETLYTLALADGNVVQVLASGQSDHAVGTSLGLRVNAARLAAFPAGASPEPALRS